MDALDALKTRRSCRAYLDRPVDAQTLDTIIEAGRFAASGMGRQPVTFVAVTDPATVKQLSHMNAQMERKRLLWYLLTQAFPPAWKTAPSPWAI